MKIQLVTPAPLKINNGNKITAVRWAGILKKLGHHVRVTQSYDGKACDLLKSNPLAPVELVFGCDSHEPPAPPPCANSPM